LESDPAFDKCSDLKLGWSLDRRIGADQLIKLHQQ
jgi:hypothetical protein